MGTQWTELLVKVEVKREEIKDFKGLEFLWEGDGVFLFSKGGVIVDVLLFGSWTTDWCLSAYEIEMVNLLGFFSFLFPLKVRLLYLSASVGPEMIQRRFPLRNTQPLSLRGNSEYPIKRVDSITEIGIWSHVQNGGPWKLTHQPTFL